MATKEEILAGLKNIGELVALLNESAAVPAP